MSSEGQPTRRGLTLAPVVNIVRRVLAGRPPVSATHGASGPRDCVRVFPALGGTVNLLGYDAAGVVQLEVRMAEDRMHGDWQAWMLDWLRAYDDAPPPARLTLHRDEPEQLPKAATRPLPLPPQPT